MKFSIIIPAFNSEKYLEECLLSVLSQSYVDFEVIGVDDGSIDCTLAIFNSFALRDNRFSVLTGPNQGLLLARRRGIQHAKGEYVLFLDSDDCLRSDTLNIIARAIDSSGSDIVAFNYSRKADFSVNDSPADLDCGLYSGKRYHLVRECVCRGRYNNLWGKAIRRRSFDVGANYDEYKGLMHGEDLLQLLPVVDRSSSLFQLPDVLYFYRPNDTSSTARFKPSQLKDIVLVNKRLNSFAREWGSECIQLAGIGESNQYCYLIKLNELSDSSLSEKHAAFNSIASAMSEEGFFERIHASNLRVDNKILIYCLSKRWWRFARLLVFAVERLKKDLVH